MPQASVTRAALRARDWRGFGALHYERHFEPLCRVLGIESVLVAPRGMLD